MFDFFHNFLQSDFVKAQPVAVACTYILAILLGASITWFYATKIHMKISENKRQELVDKVKLLENENARLRSEVEKLATHNNELVEGNQKLKFYTALQSTESLDDDDDALTAITQDTSSE